MSNANEHIEELSFAEVIGDRFGRYSKYIIQDRALPDIRDGLKPVQRRILYAMYQDRNTADHPYRKSAKTVGNVIGNYHPHGDSSVYDAMVRMSQDWKNREPLIDMHGNKGSMDGDPAAAMRYTEARLSPIAGELLRDLNYNTVDYAWNFDDTLEEPVVLPARFPNLLVNGATGISAGYATEIPPHNLGEVMDALIHMLTHEQYDLQDLLKYIQGPDFPTGAIIQGAQDIKTAYQKGKGKILLRAVTAVEAIRGGREQIVITELPYEVNKSKLIQKIDEIRITKKIEGIADVRDESDLNGVRIVVELKREVDSEGILNYLLVNTDLQINYHFNMIAIHDRRPMLVSLVQMLEAYIEHQKEVVTRRTRFQLEADQSRLHIVDGLIRLVSILDEVIATIRGSENKQDAKNNLVEQYDFSQDQAEAIVSLQLYRLTNTDVVALQNERLELNERIAMYQQILTNPASLNRVLVDEMKAIKKRFQSPRRTRVEAEIEEITVETAVIVPEERVMVAVTKDGYVKQTSTRSFSSSDTLELGMRELDYALYVQEMSTHDAILILTSQGNYIHLPVHELPEKRWKEMGVHYSQLYQLDANEQIIAVYPAYEGIEGVVNDKVDPEAQLVLATRRGMIKQVNIKDFVTYRSYKTRTAQAMKFKYEDDELISAQLAQPDQDYQVVLITARSYSLRYDLDEVSTYGTKAQGVVAINLREDDQLVAVLLMTTQSSRPQIMLLTQRGNLKRFDVTIVAEAGRGSRGILILKELKSQPHRVLSALALNEGNLPIVIQGDTGQVSVIESVDIPISERLSNGSTITDLDQLGQVVRMHPARLRMIDDAERKE